MLRGKGVITRCCKIYLYYLSQALLWATGHTHAIGGGEVLDSFLLHFGCSCNIGGSSNHVSPQIWMHTLSSFGKESLPNGVCLADCWLEPPLWLPGRKPWKKFVPKKKKKTWPLACLQEIETRAGPEAQLWSLGQLWFLSPIDKSGAQLSFFFFRTNFF